MRATADGEQRVQRRRRSPDGRAAGVSGRVGGGARRVWPGVPGCRWLPGSLRLDGATGHFSCLPVPSLGVAAASSRPQEPGHPQPPDGRGGSQYAHSARHTEGPGSVAGFSSRARPAADESTTEADSHRQGELTASDCCDDAAVDRIAGTWWHPDAPERTAHGYLLRDGNRWVLRVVGTVRPTAQHDRTHDHPTLLQGTTGTTPVSLLDCSFMQELSAGAEAIEQTWLVRTAVRGAAITGWDDPAFDLVSAELDDLANFMNLHLIEHEGRDGADDVIVIGRPPRIEATVDGVEYELFSGGATKTGARDVNYAYRAALRVRLPEPASLADIHNQHLRAMRYLLCLATAADVNIRSFKLGAAHEEDPYFPLATWPVLDVDHDLRPDREDTVSWTMLFTCSDWDFASGFPVWKRLVDKYGPTCDLLFSRSIRHSAYISTLFMNTVSAAESFHRRWTTASRRASPEHKARVARVVTAAPTGDQEWLRQKLQHSHEPSLAVRLLDLAGVSYTARAAFVGDPAAWSRAIADARNALAHRPANRDDPEEVDPYGLLALEESLAAVLTVCLMRELGFPEEECAHRLLRSWHWNHVPSVMRERHPNLFAEATQ